MDVVLLGAPGAGKGTQATAVAREVGLLHLATGDMFRDVVARDTPLGREVRQYMERGELVPDELTIQMVVERLREPDAARGVLFDGFPRTVQQAVALDEHLERMGRLLEAAVYLRVREEVLLDRLSGRWTCQSCQATYHVLFQPPARPGRCDRCGGALYQRPDDQRETAVRRLKVYFEHTLPVLEYYRGRGVLREVNGERDIASVRADLLRAIRQRVPQV